MRPAVALFLVSTAWFGMAPLAASADPPSYRARFLTPGISTVGATAMNEAGSVVGWSTTGSGGWVAHAGGVAVLLPLPPGAQHSFPNDINDGGVIVGAVGPTAYPEFGGQAAAWIPNGAGGYTVLVFGTLPGHVTSYASALNNVGDVVGYSSNGTFRYPVLFTGPGGPQDLSSTGIFDPADINDQRVLIDQSFTSKRLNLNTMEVEDLGVPAGPPTYLATRGATINESGQVAGAAIYACCPNCDRVAARFSDGVGWEVLSGCGQSNGASFINDLGDVVMRLNVAPYVRFQDSGTFRIEDLIVADVGYWYVINRAGPINNSRQMAVPARNLVTNQTGVILLTPVALAAGDLNCDGAVTFADIDPFVVALSGQAAYQAAYPDCFWLSADCDGNGVVTFADINSFVARLGR